MSRVLDNKSFSRGRILGGRPGVVSALSLIGALIFFWSASPVAHKKLIKGSSFWLSKSKAFTEIVKCTDVSDGLVCFQKSRPLLQKEYKHQFSSTVNSQLESCLDFVSQTANDLALLLSVQTCFYQADLLQSTQNLASAPKNSWTKLFCLVFSILLQLFAAAHSFIGFSLREKEATQFNENFTYLFKNSELLKESQLHAKDALCHLSEIIKNSETEISRNVNRIGEVEEDLKKANGTIENMWVAVKKLKESFYSGIQPSQSLSAFTESPVLQLSSSFTNINENDRYTNNVVSLSNTFSSYNDTAKKVDEIDRISNQPSLLNNNNINNINNNNNNDSNNDNVKVIKYECNDTFVKKSDKTNTVIKASLGGKVFDLNTEVGKKEWRDFIQKHANKSINIGSSSVSDEAHKNVLVSKIENTNYQQATTNDRDRKVFGEKIQLTLEDLQQLPKVDKNGKPFRRIFVPGFGWVSSKRSQSDAELIVKSVSDNKEN